MCTPNFSTPINGGLKLLTYNIHHGANAENRFHLEAVVEAIAGSKANIIALQEVDRKFCLRSRFCEEPERIAKKLSMNYVFRATVKFCWGGYGIMLLSKFPITDSKFCLLPKTRRLEQRGCLLGWIQTPEGNIPVACTHLGLSPQERENHIRAILEWLPPERDDVLLLGDFNTKAGARELELLQSRFTDLQKEWGLGHIGTFPANQQKRNRIDFVFGGHRWRAVNCEVLPDQSSDHLPLYVEIKPVKTL